MAELIEALGLRRTHQKLMLSYTACRKNILDPRRPSTAMPTRIALVAERRDLAKDKYMTTFTSDLAVKMYEPLNIDDQI